MTTARWRTLSSKVGIPIGRVSDPVPFGMYARCTGGAPYVPDKARCRRASLPSLGGTTPYACLRLSHSARRRLGARRFRVWHLLPPTFHEMETTEASQVPREPTVSMPCSLTPAGSLHEALTMQRRGP